MMHDNCFSWNNMGILQKLIDFANETSIHCLSFVVQTSASKLKRLTWAFLFVASLYYASFQLKQAFQCKFFWLTFKPANVFFTTKNEFLSLNTKKTWFLGGVFWEKWNFSFLTFLWNEDKSIWCEGWVGQLTFETLVNVFRFKF